MGFMAAMLSYFGRLPGQGAMEFGKEIKALNMDERNWFHAQLKANGVECDPPIVFQSDKPS